jgi:CheY-like chemotaxis protein
LHWYLRSSSRIGGFLPEAERILIVDDDPAVSDFVERVLTLAGYSTTVASNGPEALRLVHSHGPFDLLVTDVMMPMMRGDELARTVRRTQPDAKILFFTGYSERLFPDPAAPHQEAVLDKPSTIDSLLEAVSLLLDGRAPEDQAIRTDVR